MSLVGPTDREAQPATLGHYYLSIPAIQFQIQPSVTVELALT
jgi:hypothetical protein